MRRGRQQCGVSASKTNLKNQSSTLEELIQEKKSRSEEETVNGKLRGKVRDLTNENISLANTKLASKIEMFAMQSVNAEEEHTAQEKLLGETKFVGVYGNGYCQKQKKLKKRRGWRRLRSWRQSNNE